MDKATEVEIEAFLKDCSETIQKSFIFRLKPENKQTIIELGLTRKNIRDEISSLTIEHYSCGPLKDHHSTDEVWIFGKEINGKEIYIKLQISKYNDPGELVRTLYCMSFHFAKHELDYPFKK